MTVGARVVNVPADGKSRSAFSASPPRWPPRRRRSSPVRIIRSTRPRRAASSREGCRIRPSAPCAVSIAFTASQANQNSHPHGRHANAEGLTLQGASGLTPQGASGPRCKVLRDYAARRARGTQAARCLVTTLEGAARLCCRVLRDFAVEGLQASLKGRFATSLVEGLPASLQGAPSTLKRLFTLSTVECCSHPAP